MDALRVHVICEWNNTSRQPWLCTCAQCRWYYTNLWRGWAGQRQQNNMPQESRIWDANKCALDAWLCDWKLTNYSEGFQGGHNYRAPFFRQQMSRPPNSHDFKHQRRLIRDIKKQLSSNYWIVLTRRIWVMPVTAVSMYIRHQVFLHILS